MNAILCQRARAQFELFLDGALDAETEMFVTQHLLDCPACAAQVGEDVRLGDTLSRVFGSLPAERAPWVGVSVKWRMAAAAALLLIVGFGAGSLSNITTHPSGGPTRHQDAGVTDSITAAYVDPSLLLTALENEALNDKSAQLARHSFKIELENDCLRTAGKVNVDGVLKLFIGRVRASLALADRNSRDDRELMFKAGAVGEMLRPDRDQALPLITAWLDACTLAAERRVAARLLARAGGTAAIERLSAEARSGIARDEALESLRRLCEPRTRPVFEEVLADPAATPESQLRAAGGLHVLGDGQALDRLVKLFRAHVPEGERDTFRKRVVMELAARPSTEVLAVLPALIPTANLGSRDRRWLAEWLENAAPGGVRPIIALLIEGEDDPAAQQYLRQQLVQEPQ